MKNIGSQPISTSEIGSSDVIFGPVGNVQRLTLSGGPVFSDGQWTYTLADLNHNNYWDPGETLEIYAWNTQVSSSGTMDYFQFVLPNGVSRSNQFTTS
jgi:flagellar protein FlaG